MLYSGSLELLDMIGIYDRIADTGFIVRYGRVYQFTTCGRVLAIFRNATTFRDGEQFASRGWTFVQKAIDGNTHFDFRF